MPSMTWRVCCTPFSYPERNFPLFVSWHRFVRQCILARLLTQQMSITVYCLPTNENQLPFSVFYLQQTNGSCRLDIYVLYTLERQHIYIYIYRYTNIYKYIYIFIYLYIHICIYICCRFQQKMETDLPIYVYISVCPWLIGYR